MGFGIFSNSDLWKEAGRNRPKRKRRIAADVSTLEGSNAYPELVTAARTMSRSSCNPADRMLSRPPFLRTSVKFNQCIATA